MSPMQPAARKRLMGLAVILGVSVALAALSFWPSENTANQNVPPEQRARTRGDSASAPSPESIPVLKIEPSRGNPQPNAGRNPFTFYNSPTPTPTPIPPTPTPVIYFNLPQPIQPTPTPTPIIPPPIPYKVIGMFGDRDNPIVVLEEGNRIINARQGDVIDGRFIIKSINRESIDFAFVNLPPDITRRLPIALSGAGR